MQVLKFGGSSVANAANISKVAAITADAVKRDRSVLVLSAIGGCTDGLIEAGRAAAIQDPRYLTIIDNLESRHIEIIDELIPIDYRPAIELKVKNLFNQLRDVCKGVYSLRELSPYSLDLIMSFGELLSTRIASVKFTSMGISNHWSDAREIIRTVRHGEVNTADISKTYSNIRKLLSSEKSRLHIIPGFISSDSQKRTTTLGRGGSDYTASLVAAAAGARVLQIWSDVDGMMTADPRIVPDAKCIRHISYKEAQELSHFGAKVIYPPTIQPAIESGIPIEVKNTFAPEAEGTYIESSPPETRGKIRGISGSSNIALLSMEGSGMVGIPGYSSRLFGALASAGINIILITQASSVHTMCVAISESDADKAKEAADSAFAYEISLAKVNPLTVERGFSIISLVGDDMKNQSGTGGKMFNALGSEGINIRAIAQGSSEKNISVVVASEDLQEAMRVVHKEFFGERRERINLFIAGYGNVAKELIKIISKRDDIAIAGISNSRKMAISKGGIGPDKIAEALESGEEADIAKFLSKATDLGLNNSIFADCTADRIVASSYSEFALNGFSVVTCNKIALSAPLESWSRMREAFASSGRRILYETTVGAALPVIGTIRQMVQAGDKIEKIEAILSGTLNYLLSTYNGTESLATLIKKAKKLGYTEPDPRLDLSGTDVARKALILSREIGINREPQDVNISSLVPKAILDQSADLFYDRVEQWEEKFAKLYKDACSKGEKLRYVATVSATECKAEILSLPANHPLAGTEGTNNTIIITSSDYPSPIVISGAGAGARQTATGVFNDILIAGL